MLNGTDGPYSFPEGPYSFVTGSAAGAGVGAGGVTGVLAAAAAGSLPYAGFLLYNGILPIIGSFRTGSLTSGFDSFSRGRSFSRDLERDFPRRDEP